MARAWIGLGANLDDPAERVREAFDRIGRIPGVTVRVRSALYRSAPLGPQPQPDYCNAACEVESELEPAVLLEQLHEVEQQMGRARPPVRWAPRRIDLDLLHYEGVHCHLPGLNLPHPEIARRNFVLVPLAEIAPALEIPGLGRCDVAALAAGRDGLSLWPAD